MINMKTFGGRTDANKKIIRWVVGPELNDVIKVNYHKGEIYLSFNSKKAYEKAKKSTGWSFVQPSDSEAQTLRLVIPFSDFKDSFEILNDGKNEYFSEFHFESTKQPMQLKLYSFDKPEIFIENIEFFNYWHGNYMLSFNDEAAAITAQELTGWAGNFLMKNTLDIRLDENRSIVISSCQFAVPFNSFELTAKSR